MHEDQHVLAAICLAAEVMLHTQKTIASKIERVAVEELEIVFLDARVICESHQWTIVQYLFYFAENGCHLVSENGNAHDSTQVVLH